jgi:hypothetical protein
VPPPRVQHQLQRVDIMNTTAYDIASHARPIESVNSSCPFDAHWCSVQKESMLVYMRSNFRLISINILRSCTVPLGLSSVRLTTAASFL